MRIIKSLVAVAFVSALTACGPETITVTMNAQNNSNENGKAVLTEVSSGTTRVTINLTPGTDTGMQAAHIHTGTCAQLGGVYQSLNPVVSGQSTKDLAVDFEEFKKNPGKYAINVHLSSNDATYVSCGDIK